MQHLRLRIAHAVTLLHTGGIAFVKHACRCLVRSARINSGSDFDILCLFSVYNTCVCRRLLFATDNKISTTNSHERFETNQRSQTRESHMGLLRIWCTNGQKPVHGARQRHAVRANFDGQKSHQSGYSSSNCTQRGVCGLRSTWPKLTSGKRLLSRSQMQVHQHPSHRRWRFSKVGDAYSHFLQHLSGGLSTATKRRYVMNHYVGCRMVVMIGIPARLVDQNDWVTS